MSQWKVTVRFKKKDDAGAKLHVIDKVEPDGESAGILLEMMLRDGFDFMDWHVKPTDIKRILVEPQ